MGQLWYILNQDRREKLPSGKLGEFFFSKREYDGDWMYSWLHLPCIPSEVDQWLASGHTVTQPGPLANLPDDILYEIIDLLSDHVDDLFLLAITCKRILACSRPYLRKAIIDMHAPWARNRLICLGEYTRQDKDLPPGFLTPAEQHEIDTSYLPALGTLEEYEEHYKYYFSFAVETYGRANPMGGFEQLLQEVQDDIQNTALSPTQARRDIEMFRGLFRFTYHSYLEYAPGEHVLFNVSKGECVRASAVREMYGPSPKYDGPLGLIDVLLSRICWSWDRCANNMWLEKELSEQLGHGPWAGDRFVIATMEEMPLTDDGKPWNDISVEADAFLYHLWRHDQKGEPLCKPGQQGVPSGAGTVVVSDSASVACIPEGATTQPAQELAAHTIVGVASSTHIAVKRKLEDQETGEAYGGMLPDDDESNAEPKAKKVKQVEIPF